MDAMQAVAGGDGHEGQGTSVDEGEDPPPDWSSVKVKEGQRTETCVLMQSLLV